MKKVVRILGLACMAGLLVFTACKKKENTSSVNVTIPQMKVVTLDGERAYLNEDWEFTWNQNDEICVYNLSDQFDESTMQIFHNTTGESHSATFAGPEVGNKKTYGYFYFYPTTMASCDLEELANDNRQTFTVAPTQHFEAYWTENHEISQVDASQMPMAINTNDIHEHSQLRHMFGIAQFTLKGKRNTVVEVGSITLTDNHFNLWGSASLKLHEVDTLQLQQVWQEYVEEDPNFAADYDSYIIQTLGWLPNNDGGKSITLNCLNPTVVDPEVIGENGGVVLKTGNNKTEFNFMLRPLALACGFTLHIEFANGLPAMDIEKWNQPNLEYAIQPGIINQWQYNTAIEGVR